MLYYKPLKALFLSKAKKSGVTKVTFTRKISDTPVRHQLKQSNVVVGGYYHMLNKTICINTRGDKGRILHTMFHELFHHMLITYLADNPEFVPTIVKFAEFASDYITEYNKHRGIKDDDPFFWAQEILADTYAEMFAPTNSKHVTGKLYLVAHKLCTTIDPTYCKPATYIVSIISMLMFIKKQINLSIVQTTHPIVMKFYETRHKLKHFGD